MRTCVYVLYSHADAGLQKNYNRKTIVKEFPFTDDATLVTHTVIFKSDNIKVYPGFRIFVPWN